MILFDTDVSIEILRNNRRIIEFLEQESEMAAISFVSVGELFFGAFKSKKSSANLQKVDSYLKAIRIIQSDNNIMTQFGLLKANLSKSGRMLPDAYIMIAATSIVHCSKLITGNTSHFARFSELTIEDWIRP